MKAFIPALLLAFFSVSSTVASEYNTDYCHDPVKLQNWEQMLTNEPDSKPLATIHALWIGLCIKVETRQITTMQANLLFEQFRDSLVEQLLQQRNPAALGEKS